MTVRKRILLLVEDNEDNRRLVRRLVEELDATLLETDNGADGVRIARDELPDVVLMDLSLPVMNGLEATARLKSDPLTRNIPIVAITAHAMEGDREKALAAGCDAYMAKPIQIAAFIELLERFLELETH